MKKDKIKICILGRDKVGWSIDKDRAAVIHFLKETDFDLTSNIFIATHVFCVWHDQLLSVKKSWIRILKKFFRFKIIAVISNDITFAPENIEKSKKFVDLYIAPSDKVYNFLNLKKLNVYKIPFFVDSKVFRKVNIEKKQICRKLNLDWNLLENKIVVSSFQRDSLGTELDKPKWHKNPDLLIEILEKLPKEKIVLLLAGPRRHYIINKCREKGINYVFCGDYSYIEKKQDDVLVNNLSLEKINLLYNLSDLYIVTSKSEGGPKAVIESALTKTLIFSTNVGLAPYFIHEDLIFEKDEVINKILGYIEDSESFNKYIDYNYQIAINEMSEEALKEKYHQAIFAA